MASVARRNACNLKMFEILKLNLFSEIETLKSRSSAHQNVWRICRIVWSSAMGAISIVRPSATKLRSSVANIAHAWSIVRMAALVVHIVKGI